MKRLLLVAYYFPPTATSGAMRPLGFCRYLSAHGWKASVLAADSHSVWPALEIDDRLAQRLPPAIDVLRVPYTPIMRRVENWRIARRVASAATPTHAAGAAAAQERRPSTVRRALAAVQGRVSRTVEFPDRQRAWFRPAVRAALAGGCAYDAILATGGPWTTLRVGAALAREWRLPLISDFRDPWTRNPSYHPSSPSLRGRAARLERQVCEQSAVVIANTEELRQQFAADHPQIRDRFVTITNGFDSATVAAARSDGERFDLCHFGTVYGGRAPVNLLRAIEMLADAGALHPARFRLRFVGRWEVDRADCNELAARLGARGLVTREAPIPHDACLSEMQRAGALLVLQSGFPLQVPAKIYEYVATGRPIAFVGDEGATASLIRRHALGLACPDDVAAARTMVQTLTTAAAPSGRTDRGQFHYRALTAQLAAVLDRAVGLEPMRTAS